MADNGYVAVSVDYDDDVFDYTNGCDGSNGFRAKSRAIFDPNSAESVTISYVTLLLYRLIVVWV